MAEMGEQFGDLVLELRAASENMVANGPRSDSLPELMAAAAREIEGTRRLLQKYKDKEAALFAMWNDPASA